MLVKSRGGAAHHSSGTLPRPGKSIPRRESYLNFNPIPNPKPTEKSTLFSRLAKLHLTRCPLVLRDTVASGQLRCSGRISYEKFFHIKLYKKLFFNFKMIFTN